MKVAYIAQAYPGVVEQFYAARPGLERESAAVQRAAWEAFAFGWAGGWGPALAPFGVELHEFWLDLAPMHEAWAREHDSAATGGDLVVEGVRAFAPDVLWLDGCGEELLARLRAGHPAPRLVAGWVGSALPDRAMWKEVDLVLSCDAMSVRTLRAQGVRAELLHHAFQPAVLARLIDRAPRYEIAFAGQFDPGAPAHAERERTLEALLATREVAIFSPKATRPGAAAAAMRTAAWNLTSGLRSAGVPDEALKKVPGLGKAAAWPGPPRGELPERLAAAIQPARYGLDMYQTLKDARVSLNVQGAGRTHESSNMRLFESTGAGSALLTDAAASLATFFAPDREVVTFASAAECAEKATWLLEHEPERAAIARAGHERCLAEHTFAHRAPRLVEVLRAALP